MAVTSRQYRNVLFYHDERQRELAEASLIALPREGGLRVQTPLEPAGVFTRAEDYHQKFYLRAVVSVFDEVYSYYSTDREFVDSTLATRLNGYFGGNGSLALYEAESHLYGLSEASLALVRDRAESSSIDCGPQ